MCFLLSTGQLFFNVSTTWNLSSLLRKREGMHHSSLSFFSACLSLLFLTLCFIELWILA